MTFRLIVLWLLIGMLDAHADQRIADQKNLIFDRLGSENGLSQGIVNAVAQDQHGFIWVGTQEGLNRYDGYRFDNFYHIEGDSNSLSHDYIRSVFFDSAGKLWIGTEGGLNTFDESTQTFSSVDIGTGELTSVYAIAEDTQGNLWLCTSMGVIQITSGVPELIGFSDGLANESVRSIEILKDGDIWIGTEGKGVYSFRPSTGLLKPLDVSLRDKNVRAILEDSSGFIWIATFNGGVVRYDRHAKTHDYYYHDEAEEFSLGSNRTRSLLEDHEKNIWIATDRGLHTWLGGQRFRRYVLDLANPRSLSDNTILSLFQDEGGVVWIGTFNGLNKWNAKVDLFPYFRRPKSEEAKSESNNITSFADNPSGDVWIGTLSGLMKWDVGQTELVSLESDFVGLNDSRVMSLEWVNETIWAGTINGGVNIISNDRVIEIHQHDPFDPSSLSSNAITTILRTEAGAIWVTTYGGGVNQYLGNGRYRRFPGDTSEFPDLRCMDIVEGPDQKFWIATQGGGVVILDPLSGHVEVIQKETHSIPSNDVISLLRTSSGMWIGTVDRGMSFFEFESKKFTSYSKKDGLASDAVYGLIEDGKGMIWASGGKGLSLFNPSSQKFKLFDSSHGLQSSDFNSGAYAKLNDGSVVFGGNNGFNAFYPQNIRLNDYVPPVHITGFNLFNEKADLSNAIYNLNEIELDYTETVLGFKFAALDYTAPEKNSYRYKLEGFDRDWVEHRGKREVTYTNLDAASYIFRVQGSNNDDVWNEEGASLALLVRPAPWLTWWAYCIYVAIAAFGFYLLLRLNSDRLKREAERRYSERLQLYIESLEEASDCILIADSSGTLLYANNTITEGLNKFPSEVIGESLWSVLFEDEKDVEEARESLLDEGRYHGEVQLEGTDRTAVTHEVTIAAVQQSSTNDLAYVGISRDVTERKVTEAELEDYRKNLEQLVEERTKALQKEIAENKAIQVHLAESLQEKELLIKEVHHRVKNNMQVISSLLSIQAEGAKDELYSNLLNESQQRIKSMALIHETLYQSKDLLKIDFQEYIETLTTSLNRSYSVPGVSVHVAVNVENVSLDLETAVPCGLVINELVSNALKHAFLGMEGTGIIDIRFVSNDCHYDLRISDNGCGLPEGFDPDKNLSMGMEIVSILTMQLEGKLKAHNEEGAVFEIRFPRRVHA